MGRWGCMSGTGLLVGLVTPVAVVLSAFMTGGEIFSPGSLSAATGSEPLGGAWAHTDLTCGECHAPFWSGQRMNERCLACHVEIQAELANPDALHGAVPSAPECRQCHTEHLGPQGSLTLVQGTDFPHDAFGSSLLAHSGGTPAISIACQDCHVDSLMTFSDDTCAVCHLQRSQAFATEHALTYGLKCLACHDGIDSYGKSFDHQTTAFPLVGEHLDLPCSACHLGATSAQALQSTPSSCFSCHQADDVHLGRLGDDCSACHSPENWDVAAFDHGLTRFPLAGSHTSLACQSCHVDGQMAGIPLDCVGCHLQDDIHAGRLGPDCMDCHQTTTWDDVIDANFNHSLTRFALTGAHVSVACQNCHRGGQLQGIPSTCVGCHRQDDAHNGQLGTGCATCHSTSSWKPATFDHGRTAFPLTGSHQAAQCAACHTNGVFNGTPSTCFACHQQDDKHKGQFGTQCASCHTTVSWKGATVDHNKTAFPLSGAHLLASCTTCHINGVFKGTPTACIGCHRQDDKHAGQFGANCASCHSTTSWKGASIDHNRTAFPLTGAHALATCGACHVNGVFKGTPTACLSCHQQDDKHNGQFGANCGACHTTASWTGASIDHTKTAFPLTGAHVRANCGACHVNGVYKGTPTACLSCHRQVDKHNGQFGTDCGACHSTASWAGASFDHSRTAFPLTGAHTLAACTSCHSNGSYQGTPSACSACHTEPAYHAGLFGTSCQSCHNTQAWRPAQFNQPHAFPMSHGGANGSCLQCHPAAFGSYTCYQCHNQAEITKKHLEEGFPDFSNCMDCHPDGRKHD